MCINVSSNISVIIHVLYSVFISKYGNDYVSCGNDLDPCGSIDYVSTLINGVETWDTVSLYIIDGQNRTKNSPCPITYTFNTLYHININFDSQHIQNFSDWYPFTCSNGDQYLFQGGASLSLHNLIISDYSGFILNSTSMHCRQCVFSDIKLYHGADSTIQTMFSLL